MAGVGQSARKLTMDDIRAAAERLKNWGRWGANDEIGTLNYTRPEDIMGAAQLVRKGKVISLALPYDHRGPQGGTWTRTRPWGVAPGWSASRRWRVIVVKLSK